MMIEQEALKKSEYITFAIGEEMYAFPINVVQEIVRMPALNRFPLAQEAVDGIAIWRNSLLLVINGRAFLRMVKTERTTQTRVIVIQHKGHRIGITVDKIVGVRQIEADEINAFKGNHEAFLAGVSKAGQKLVFHFEMDEAMIAWNRYGEIALAEGGEEMNQFSSDALNQDSQHAIHQYVRFFVNQEGYGLSIANVRDIVRLPQKIDRLAGGPFYLLGLGVIRDEVLPIVHLAKLLGANEHDLSSRARVIITEVEVKGHLFTVGLAVSSVSEVMRLMASEVEELPSALQSNETEYIIGVYKETKQGSNELMYMLDLAKLLPFDDMYQFSAEIEAAQEQYETEQREHEATEQLFLIFQMNDEKYGFPVQAVREILRIPEITPVPHSAYFLSGVANIRGQLVSVINLRQRLALTDDQTSNRQRIVIVENDEQIFGITVDHILGVVKLNKAQLEEMHQDEMGRQQFVKQIAKLEQYMVMLLDLKGICADL